MDKTKSRSPTIDEVTKPLPESTDPDYLAWRDAEIRAAIKDADDHPAEFLAQEKMSK